MKLCGNASKVDHEGRKIIYCKVIEEACTFSRYCRTLDDVTHTPGYKRCIKYKEAE